MQSPITIVIPAYNRERVIGRTLDSVEGQSMRPAKVVLVDNGSSDSTGKLMERRAMKMNSEGWNVTVVNESRRGATAARNRGFSEVESEFVMFFDSDDEMLPDHVRDFSDAIISNPRVDIFGRDILTRQLDGTTCRHWFTDRRPMFNHIFRGCLSTQRIVVRSALVRKVGAWDESLPAWNDYEFGIRLLLASNRIMSLGGAPTVLCHQLADSITGTSFSSKAGKWELALDRIENSLVKAGRRDMVRWIDARRMILAAEYSTEGRDDLADPLMRQVMTKPGNAPRRMKAIYLHRKYLRRLTWLSAGILFPPV